MAAALLVLGLQIFIGGRVVLEELPIDRVVTHLLLAFLFFALLLRITLRVQDGPEGRPNRNARWRESGAGQGGRAARAGGGACQGSSSASLVALGRSLTLECPVRTMSEPGIRVFGARRETGADGRRVSEFVSTAIAAVRSVAAPGGHFFPEQHPRETAEALLAFLAG